MKKYFTYFKICLYQYFIYRINFILWRLRNFLNMIFLYFLWTSINNTNSFNYSGDKLITYIFLINILYSIILSSRTEEIPQMIIYGELMNIITKPISFFKLIITKEITDKIVNIFFSILEISLLIVLFKPNFFIQNNIFNLIMMIFFILLASILSFFIDLILAFIAFWSTETWGPRFIFYIIVSILSGSVFPLDILPEKIYNLLLLTPFPYLVYFPAKIFLNKLDFLILNNILILLIWIITTFFLARKMWQKGIKNYSFYGR